METGKADPCRLRHLPYKCTILIGGFKSSAEVDWRNDIPDGLKSATLAGQSAAAREGAIGVRREANTARQRPRPHLQHIHGVGHWSAAGSFANWRRATPPTRVIRN